MASCSDFVILLLVFVTCSLHRGAVAQDCERENGNVLETSKCLGCSGCYQIVESSYNLTLKAHDNFTANFEHFQNLTQMGVSQVVEMIRSMLEEHHQLAIKTAAVERNVTSQLLMIQNQTVRIQHFSNILGPELSAVANTSQDVTTTHGNHEMNTTQLDMLVSAISSIITHNITTLLRQAEMAYNESVAKLEQLAVVAADANMTSHQQEELTMTILSIVEEARNVSSTALDTVCWGLRVQNMTRGLVEQLNNTNIPKVLELVQQIESLVQWIEQTSLEVFNMSGELVQQVLDNVPSYNIELLGNRVDILYLQASELSENVNATFEQLQGLRGQAGNLNVTVVQLFEKGAGLERLANQLLVSANASLVKSRQGFNQAEPVINEIDMLFRNLTKYSDLIKEFNMNLTEVMTKLAEVDNVTSLADNVTTMGQSDIERVEQLLEEVRWLLGNATATYMRILTALDDSWRKINDINNFLGNQVKIAGGVIDQADGNRRKVEAIDEQIVNQTSDLHQINQTSSTVLEELAFIMRQLDDVRSELASLSERLRAIKLVSEEDLETLNLTVSRLSKAVEENERLIETAQEKVTQLIGSTDQLEDKNKQLKQHRDLLRKIKDNIGSYTCTLSN